ncbi:MAG TPA: acetyl-CoA carboxylase biotin carboxylase subunit [Anaerolineae bacterium]|nr:acetyl-CoA carboxylase biotin carboxylase subunit [Anaerolineae bacterium]
MSNPTKFTKILIANRGEIARRLCAACRQLNIPSVAIYSEADADAAWLDLADEAFPLPGVTATESYLNQDAIFAIAQQAGANAIHPGYGFLSENANFAAACADHNITFIGPSPAAMNSMGSKATARAIAQEAGVPIVPGLDGAGHDDQTLKQAADDIGYPVLIKASAGGGGKGMRVVNNSDDFADALQAARSEAQNSFGDAHVIIEKYFTAVHHVEIQILADHHGTTLHLFERECSLQRRHQKIVEESPAPILPNDDVRQAMAQAAVSLAQQVGYVSAGTVEFIATPAGDFYFLEMNTRLQVEHPVTELTTGLDIATWQIRIAAGEPLPYTQADIQQRGHAIECRLYAEDPANMFLPSIGDIVYYKPAHGPNIRMDDGIATGSAVTPYYDPMLAKLVTWGATRDEAINKMRQALRQTAVVGVTTNIPYLLDIFDQPEFLAGRTSTNYLAEKMPDWQPAPEASAEDWLAAAAWEILRRDTSGATTTTTTAPYADPDPWNIANGWRNV